MVSPLIVADNLPDEFSTAKHGFCAGKTGYLHVAVLEDINLGTLADKGNCDEHAVRTMPRKRVVIAGRIEALKKLKK